MIDTIKLKEKFSKAKVLIIGDVMIDSYVWGRVSRISPEAPVPIVNVNKREIRLGGAGNVALNIKALGAEPILCGVAGNDEESRNLRYLLAKSKMQSKGMLFIPDRLTTVKHRILAGSQHMLRIDTESDTYIDEQYRNHLFEFVERQMKNCDVVIFEDYDKGVLSAKLIQQVIELAKKHKVPTVVDPKKKQFLDYSGAALFKPNLKELKEGLKVDFKNNDFKAIESSLKSLNKKMSIGSAMVTLSENGVMISNFSDTHKIAAHKREIADVSGAGDTVISLAALCLASGVSLEKVAEISNLGGGLVCEQLGVVPVNLDLLISEIERLKL